MNKPLPHLKTPLLIQKKQEEQSCINFKLNKSSDNWRNGKLKFHWFKLEWVSPRKSNYRKKYFPVNEEFF